MSIELLDSLETTIMGTTNIGIMKFMLPETTYQTLAGKLDDQSKGIDSYLQ